MLTDGSGFSGAPKGSVWSRRMSQPVGEPTQPGPVLVVDFGAQYAQLIARRVREAQRLQRDRAAHDHGRRDAREEPGRRSCSRGGPSSRVRDGRPELDPALFEPACPTLGICYGFQVMAQALGGEVARTGRARVRPHQPPRSTDGGAALAGQPAEQTVWMSHGDSVAAPPEGFEVPASTAGAPVAAFENDERRIYGVQWHPEVKHSAHGQPCSRTSCTRRGHRRRLDDPATSSTSRSPRSARRSATRRVICGLSGGVDSAVAAALVHRAVGDQLTCVFVDHGLLRKGEREQVERDYVAATGMRLDHASTPPDQFLDALAGVTDPEEKRKIIGARVHPRLRGGAARGRRRPRARRPIEFLVQGTLYPDVVESGGGTGTANIKSHHNVGGLPDDLQFELVEPLRALFKDEVRAVGAGARPARGDRVAPAVPRARASAIRIVGEVTPSGWRSLREADAIAREELEAAGLERDDLAVPGRAARRRALGGRAGRRPHLRATRSCCARSPARTR